MTIAAKGWPMLNTVWNDNKKTSPLRKSEKCLTLPPFPSNYLIELAIENDEQADNISVDNISNWYRNHLSWWCIRHSWQVYGPLHYDSTVGLKIKLFVELHVWDNQRYSVPRSLVPHCHTTPWNPEQSNEYMQTCSLSGIQLPQWQMGMPSHRLGTRIPTCI